jgi:16S rRNA (uracil1498-N3)-methyltransferase
MKKPRFRLYVTHDLNADTKISLPDKNVHYNQVHYLRNVMRAYEGENALIFNGKDGEWLARIDEIGKKTCSLTLLEQTRPQEDVPDLWLLFAPIKRAKIDIIVEKATELGASVLQPVITQNTYVSKVNIERLAANITEATEQCERLTVPTINSAVSLQDILKEWNEDRTLFFMDESGGGKTAIEVFNDNKNPKAAILTGPEGGFSAAEFELLRSLPFAKGVGLGPRILKAETAVCAAMSCWQAVCGDWQKQPSFKAEN